MSEKIRETAIHASSAAAAWCLAHYLSGRLLKGRDRRGVTDDAKEALLKSGAHAASVVLASVVVRRSL